MATGKAQRGRTRPGRRMRRIAVAAALLIGIPGWYFQEEVKGYSGTATAYSARTVCACRHVGGRSLRQCKDDLGDARLALVFLTEDKAARSVTARVPLLSTQTATYRKDWGCLLQPWER